MTTKRRPTLPPAPRDDAGKSTPPPRTKRAAAADTALRELVRRRAPALRELAKH